MIKRYCILIITVLSTIVVSCRHTANTFQEPTKTAAGFLVVKSDFCLFDNNDIPNKISITLPDTKELNQVNDVMKFSGLPQNFKIYSGNINTALATVVNDQQLLIYNKKLFVDNKTDNAYWSSLFIIAHEIGHHLASNLSDTGNAMQAELDADRFASIILYRMGADSNQVLAAFHSGFIADVKDLKIRPSKSKRIEIVKTGWRKAFELRYQSVIPPPIDDMLYVKEFSDKNLIFNSDVRYMFQSELENKDESIKSEILNFLSAPTSKNLKGIILDVKNLEDIQDVQDEAPEVFGKHDSVIRLKLVVLLTKIDTAYKNQDSNDDFMIANHTYEFEVWYEPVLNTDKTADFLRFFVIGRRFEFDIINIDYNSIMAGFPLNIFRAKAIYNSY